MTQVTKMLKEAFVADYVLLGGGNAKLVQPLPAGARCGGNEDAFTGGFRLWRKSSNPTTAGRRQCGEWCARHNTRRHEVQRTT